MAIHAKFSIPTACVVFARDRPRPRTPGGSRRQARRLRRRHRRHLRLLHRDVPRRIAGQGPSHPGRVRPLGPQPAARPVRDRRARLAGPARRRPDPLRPRLSQFGCRLGPTSPPSPGPRRPDSRPNPSRRAPTAAPAVRRARPGVVLVVRVPRINAPMPSLIDRYISRLYLRVAGVSFFALLGLFYISTFIDQVRQDVQGPGQRRDGRPSARAADAAVRLLRHPDRRAAERARDLRAAGAQQRADRHEGVRDQPLPHGAVGRHPVARNQRRALRPRAAADGERESAGRGPRRQDPRPPAEDAEPAQSALGRGAPTRSSITTGSSTRSETRCSG